MSCKRSEQCDHADICQYAKSDAYDILGGSCYRPKKPQTNDEWRRTCSAEEFAEWITELSELCTIHHECDLCDGWCDEKKVVEWLKQPHTNE